MCSITMLKRLILSGPWSASTRPRPADRRGAPAGPGPTGTTRAVRLRVSPQRHPNLFVTFDPYRGWRNVKVTDRRAAVDYAHCMRELVDVHYPGATCIRVVQDNLSIHKPGALYEAFAPAEARRILRRLEFHFTPEARQLAQHARVRDLRASAPVSRPPHRRPQKAPKPDRRMATAAKPIRARIKWMFTTDKARAKLGRAYPVTAKESTSL
ncbi:transposase [Bradyrhizobium sp. S3.2.6]|uniref:transposase n=1 Tax=unclassified Bradyrhizobium TaxID=2631580 RepID=UPI003399E3FA